MAADGTIRAAFRERFARLLTQATGSSTRITRAVLLGEPLSIDHGEVTDKGSVNQRAVLEHRAALIADLYTDRRPRTSSRWIRSGLHCLSGCHSGARAARTRNR